MKIFLYICSLSITLWFFMPFVWDTSLFNIYHTIQEHNYIRFDLSFFIRFIITLIISSWFISLWYSKKIKISIFWIIGSLVYLSYYFDIFNLLLNYGHIANKSYNTSLSFIWEKNTIEMLVYLIDLIWGQLNIGFYMITIWFLLNSIAIINIIGNLIKKVEWSKDKYSNNITIKKENNNIIKNKSSNNEFNYKKVINEIINTRLIIQNIILFSILLYFLIYYIVLNNYPAIYDIYFNLNVILIIIIAVIIYRNYYYITKNNILPKSYITSILISIILAYNLTKYFIIFIQYLQYL